VSLPPFFPLEAEQTKKVLGPFAAAAVQQGILHAVGLHRKASEVLGYGSFKARSEGTCIYVCESWPT
jgi:hypothetical protein